MKEQELQENEEKSEGLNESELLLDYVTKSKIMKIMRKMEQK